MSQKATPHRCPICNGSGQVDQSLYKPTGHGSIGPQVRVSCRTCDGKGIVWSFEITFVKEASQVRGREDDLATANTWAVN